LINARSITMTDTNEFREISAAPDAMNQTIYDMIMLQKSNQALSRSISGMHSSDNTTDSMNSSQKINTGIPLHIKNYLPYPIPWKATAGPDEIPPDYGFMSNCAGKAAIGLFGGAGMGLLMGVFLGAMSDMSSPITVLNGKEVPQAPLREQMRTTMRATAEKSMYWSRNFAFITAVFGGSDCLVEKYRGTHDVWNAVISGCVTGAAMQAKQGPQAAAIGCGGFAAFSLVIDKVMGTH